MTPGKNGHFPADPQGAASVYLAWRLAPIPLPHRSKNPGYEGWNRLRLSRESVAEHFPSGRLHNVGVLNGAPSGDLADADLDCPEALAAADLLLPNTGWVFGRKSAPRAHRLYRTDRPLDAAQENYVDLDGTVLLELRGTGGMTVFPPSVHDATGEAIAWDRFEEPALVGLDELRRAARCLAAACLLARHWPSKGVRQNAFLALAGGLARGGWEAERVGQFVAAVAAATGDEEARKRAATATRTASRMDGERKATGWPTLERLLGAAGTRVVRQVREWLWLRTTPTKRQLRPPEPYGPFPVDSLPEPVAAFVRDGALALGCDPAYLALPALAAAASAIGNARAVRLKRGWEEPCVVWAAVVGDSGTLKSPAYQRAVGYLFRVQKRLLLEFKEKTAAYTEALQEYQAAKRQAKEDGADPPAPPEAPVLQRVVCSDTTIEKLAEVLEDNPRGLLVARDELAGWLGSFTRYKGKQGGTDLPLWLEAFRAGAWLVDRKTGDRKHYFIPHAAVSVAGGIQPGVLARALTPEFLDAGLAARLLMAMPPKRPKRWTEDEVDPEVEGAYQGLLDRLLALVPDADADGSPAPHVLGLSPEAKAAWVAFYREWAREQAAAEGELAAALSKLEAYAARLALLHHVVTHAGLEADDRRPVGVRSVEAGAALCRWFAAEARRIYATLSESAEDRDARRLVEFLQARGGRISVRGLMRANCRRYPDAGSAEVALRALVEAGLARWVEVPARKQGSPGKAAELCMTHDTHDTIEDDGPDDRDGPHDNHPDDGDDPHDNSPDAGSGSGTASPFQTTASGTAVEEIPGDRVIRVMRHAQETDSCESGDDPNETETSPSSLSCAADSPAALAVIPVMRPPTTVADRCVIVVRDGAGLQTALQAVDESDRVGLDTETTGLNPRIDRIRLLQLATDRGVFLVDCFAVDPAPLWPALADKPLIVHNAAFDLAFLARRGFAPAAAVHDTMLLAQLLTADTGDRVTLAACCRRWLGLEVEKAGQKSDWSGDLTEAQLAYAAADAAVVGPLLGALNAEVREAGLADAAEIERRCLAAVVWMAGSGVPLDRDPWGALASAAAAEADRLRGELDRAAPPRPGALFSAWNWDGAVEAREALALAGCAVPDTADATLAAAEHPLAALLRQYREARKRSGTYGSGWLAHVAADGRVYPRWRQLGAASGRMSCCEPNMQQLPRGEHRRCVAAPPGRVLVKADYSQVELRIAAKVAGDEALLGAYRRGEDLHARTARAVLGVTDVTKEHRQLAKALNFGLLYGMGAAGFQAYARSQYGLGLSAGEARRYRAAFFKEYPGLAAWHRRVGAAGEGAVETRTLSGRRRLGVVRFTERLNTPVQGTGADGLKRALALLWERRGEAPGAFPVLAVHDEIVVECAEGQADAVTVWLRRAMEDALGPLLDPVPVGVEVRVARTWGGG